MILITSAAYITHGLRSEFGMLPPVMLPVQNLRLYEHQFRILHDFGNIVLTLPKSFDISAWDRHRMSECHVTIVSVPDGMKLGESIVYALNVTSRYNEPLYILHGDTLFDHIEQETDVAYISDVSDDYKWDTADLSEQNVYAGFFSFEQQPLLIQKITECGYDFIRGVEAYGSTRPIKNIKTDSWMDFGIVNSYYRSASRFTTQRAFNNISASAYSLIKRSKDKEKILAEASWFEHLPADLKHYAPTVWRKGSDDSSAFYETEYYYLTTLSNLFVYGRNPLFVWNEIFESCHRFLSDLTQFRPEQGLASVVFQNNRLWGEKTRQRVELYAQKSGIDLSRHWTINGQPVPSIVEIMQETSNEITQDEERFACIMHGDFCFSNILYDFKSKNIRVIDPRGIDSDRKETLYGDLRYDVAKLAHSVIGLYDFIIGGLFHYEEKSEYDILLSFYIDNTIPAIQKLFITKRIAGFSMADLSVYPIMIHLFLSMLPLHSDRPLRQKAMLANALRLYVEFKKQKVC